MSNFKETFKKDYFRNTGGGKYVFYKYLLLPPKIKFLYWFRKTQFAKLKICKVLYRIILYRFQLVTGNEISWRTKVGPGLYLGHNGARYVNSEAIIGKNVNLNQNVTIGQENRGKRKGSPTISDNVWIGAGSVIVGKIIIGENVLISPNSFVNFDVPDNSIVIGSKCSILPRDNATEDYICQKV